ncbi:glyceraldehyde-3-phosphate dehydrogenase (NADP+) [Allocatelliglobosispora scoriae]|uniref:Glyceraldehyde-3-phosphate dehydrogenase (NADP+) n=1 Tax=Allocatelliglobosispora scoriae TaxID=643052 RepID=A0A841BRD0_9ACTN|nr:aldehyde dehydrogenase family protein [Allocatelliglobosispora scoriae]MBB5870255.1 glyceraldehyde-3-phosphate dehydrogenase (NADP+) [Allocatelliglobosispora scoriae]
MTEPVVPFWIAGSPESSADLIEVRSPYDGRLVATTSQATPSQVDRAVQAAADVAAEAASLPASVRAAALDHISKRLAERGEEVARLISAENGKPIMWARAELGRAVSTFRWAAEEARRFSGDLQRLDTDPAAKGRLALVRRFPKGPVLGITPFNFPLNLVAHKVAPAIAVGAPIVIKPAPATPLSALLLGSLIAETELPVGMFSVVPVPNAVAPDLVADPRLPVVSFTGSGPVGAQIRAAVPHKHVTLELGGNAAAVICEDYADLDWAAARVALFSNYQAGQSCIAVQRVIVHSSKVDDFLDKLVNAVGGLVVGDPSADATQVGPLINEAAAERVESWVAEAVEAGAKVLVGGVRDGASYAPTVIVDAPADAKVCAEEVFGPVLVVQVVDSDEEAFAAVNRSAFGLQAGVFTTSIQTAFSAHATLQVGGVIIGDVPSFRADQMPYGGQKGSGTGREGVASAMQDYTDPRVLVLTNLAL